MYIRIILGKISGRHLRRTPWLPPVAVPGKVLLREWGAPYLVYSEKIVRCTIEIVLATIIMVLRMNQIEKNRSVQALAVVKMVVVAVMVEMGISTFMLLK